MALSTVNRESSTRRDKRAPDFYLAYLNSPGWRQTRNQALQRAGFTCQRCGARRDLNVHHLSYERLGLERTEDLEVLCFTCHNEHHRDEAEESDSMGVYLRLVSVVLERNRWARLADLSEDVKVLCAQKKIPVDPPKIHKAISLVCATRLKDSGQPFRSVVEDIRPDSPEATQAQAVELLARLGMGGLVKTMPAASGMNEAAINEFRRQFVWKR